jgi:hypothetical protein
MIFPSPVQAEVLVVDHDVIDSGEAAGELALC